MGKRRSCQDSSGWCGLCYANVRGRANYKGHCGYRVPRSRFWSYQDMAITRRSGPGGAASDTPMSQDCAFCKAYPGLAEFISKSRWEDGTDRTLGTIMLLCEEGRAKVWVNDKDAGLSCWVSGDTVTAALRAAEKAVVGSGGDWRRPPATGRRRS